MNEKQTDLIIKVNDRFKHMRKKEERFHTITHITSYAFDEKAGLDFREIGTLVLLSKFNVWTPADVELRTMLLNVDTIASIMKTKRTSENKLFVDGIKSLSAKGVIEVIFLNPDYTIENLEDAEFYITQKFYSHHDKFDEETFQAYDGVPGFENYGSKRATVGMYLDEIDKIINSNENINNKIKMMSMYAAICKPIYYSAYNSDEKKAKIDVKRRAVNWFRIEEIGKNAGFSSMESIRKHIKSLLKYKVISRVDLRYNGNTIYHTRVYFCRYIDSLAMVDVIIHQIKDNKIFNILNAYKF